MVHSTPPHTVKMNTGTLFLRVIEAAPMGLMLSAALGLCIAGVFQYIFYLSLLPASWSAGLRTAMSAGLAVFFEALAFFFLVATVRDFTSGAKREGWIGASASLLLLGYCGYEAIGISSRFDDNTPEGFWAILSIIGTITLAVRVVELRITLTVTSAYRAAAEAAEHQAALSEAQGEARRLFQELKAYKEKELSEGAAALAAEEKAKEAEAARKADEIKAALTELERLRKAVQKSEAAAPKNRKAVVSKTEILTTALRHFDGNSGRLTATRERIAAELNTSARTIAAHFPNGSLEAQLKALQNQKRQAAELTEESL